MMMSLLRFLFPPEFQAALSSLPFYALPFEDLVRRKRLMTLFRAETLPMLMLLGPGGEVREAD